LNEVLNSHPEIVNLDNQIDFITNSLSRPHFSTALKKLAKSNSNNAKLICEYILVEETEPNLKNSTNESKIKILVWLSNFHNGTHFIDMTKKHILEYLSKLRKPTEKDPSSRWIGSYNGRQAGYLSH
jgi:hypothetical protein